MGLILGHDRALSILDHALQAGRLSHGWIFSGPSGTGKFTTARALASVLLDPSDADVHLADISADHLMLRELEAGTHADFHVIRKELARYSSNPLLHKRKLRNIPIDVLREFMIGGRIGQADQYFEPPAYKTAARGHGKVFIIDEAELLDGPGQSAVLKTLEEPPTGTYIILVTSRPERLLPTIHSRCQHVTFGPLDDGAMAEWFRRSGLDLDPAERAWIEAHSDGSPGMALVASEYGFHGWSRRLQPMLAALESGRYPSEMGELLAELIDGFAVAWEKRHENASKDAANKDGTRYMLALLGNHARQKLAQSALDQRGAALWASIISLLHETEGYVESNINIKQVMENLVTQWLRRVEHAGAGVA